MANETNAKRDIQIFRDLIKRGVNENRAKNLITRSKVQTEEKTTETLAERALRQADEFGKTEEEKTTTLGEDVEAGIRDDIKTTDSLGRAGAGLGTLVGTQKGDFIGPKEKGTIQQTGEAVSKFGTESKFKLKRAEGKETIGQQLRREVTNLGKLGANISTDVLEISGGTADFIGEIVDDPNAAIEPLKTLGTGFLGLIKKASRLGLELGTGQDFEAGKEEQIANAIGQGIKDEAIDKFGTIDKARDTIAENPLDAFLFVRGGLKGLKNAGLSKADNIKIDKLTKESDNAIEQFLKPTKETTKTITKKITPEIQNRLKNGTLTPGDREAIKAITDANVESVGQEIGKFIKEGKVKGEIDFDKMIDVLAKEDSKLRIDGNIIPGNETSSKFINSQIDFLGQLERTYGKNLPAAKQLELRQKYDVIFDKSVTRDKITKFQDDLQVKLADSLRAELAKNNPDLDKLNKEFTFNKGLQTVLDETLNRTTGQDPVGLITELRKTSQGTAGAAAGAGIGGFIGGPAGATAGAVLGGITGAKLTKVLSSPKYKLIDAKKKIELANAIAEGNTTKVDKILDALTVSLGISIVDNNE